MERGRDGIFEGSLVFLEPDDRDIRVMDNADRLCNDVSCL